MFTQSLGHWSLQLLLDPLPPHHHLPPGLFPSFFCHQFLICIASCCLCILIDRDQETDWLEGWHHWVDQNPHHLKDFCESLNVCNNSQMLILSQLPKTFIWRFKSVSSSMIRLKRFFCKKALISRRKATIPHRLLLNDRKGAKKQALITQELL